MGIGFCGTLSWRARTRFIIEFQPRITGVEREGGETKWRGRRRRRRKRRRRKMRGRRMGRRRKRWKTRRWVGGLGGEEETEDEE